MAVIGVPVLPSVHSTVMVRYDIVPAVQHEGRVEYHWSLAQLCNELVPAFALAVGPVGDIQERVPSPAAGLYKIGIGFLTDVVVKSRILKIRIVLAVDHCYDIALEPGLVLR